MLVKKFVNREINHTQSLIYFCTLGIHEPTLVPEARAQLGIGSISVVMVDCVLYSSTRHALAFCAPLIREEAVFVLDNWEAGEVAEHNLGEKAAFEEFLVEHPEFVAREIGEYTHWEQDVPTKARTFAVERRAAQAAGA